MTTRTAVAQQSKREILGLIGATALTMAVLGGVAISHIRPESETTAPATSATTRIINEGVTSRGGVAERFADQQAETAFRGEATIIRGGMAEFYSDRQVPAGTREAQVPVMGGLAEMYRNRIGVPFAYDGPAFTPGLQSDTMGRAAGRLTDQRAAGREASVPTMGGMAEHYADQRAAASRTISTPVTVPTAQQLAEWDQEQRYQETAAAVLSARATTAASRFDSRIGGLAEMYLDASGAPAFPGLTVLAGTRRSDSMGGLAEMYAG
jgi:hypothetical protein